MLTPKPSIVAFLPIVLLAGFVQGEDTAPLPGDHAEATAESAPPQIEAWVKNLSAGRFAERELATQELIDAGEAAIGPVSAAVRGEGLETLERGLIVLKQLALADDEATEDAARAALEDLAKEDKSRAALRARRTLDVLNELRQDRAIAALRKLGATVDENTYNQFVGVWQLQTSFSVTIDDDWHGGERGLKYLRWLPDLQTVTFRGKQVQDQWLASVSGLEKLAIVEINRASVSDAAVKQLGTLPALSRLTVKYSPLTDAAIDDLKELKMASLIMLYGTKITPDGAEKLTAAAGANVKIDYRRARSWASAASRPKRAVRFHRCSPTAPPRRPTSASATSSPNTPASPWLISKRSRR